MPENWKQWLDNQHNFWLAIEWYGEWNHDELRKKIYPILTEMLEKFAKGELTV